ncbi:hypothetical protein [Leuconostoc mesenteroides]|jgi:hypothetical protein|uniref:hypothetical protein n=1 Tax=Leuconostoc mesenteroides TaxID=1245 RepID=UPI001CBC3630|nr:hypothetical protein [Leuconostoc mesenteroides]MBZ1528087.1 hypothetical protein [Leuconostoc mesenteroides]MCI2152396.1 hypothetical protein [Leuconostoc mesenteroides]MCI2168213.1 hypothetical protein [Leuconostoc mesenteroides]
MNYDDKLIEEIKKRFTKQKNTLYWVRIVYQRYSKQLNVFFEYAKIGMATHSEQIGRYVEYEKDRMPELAKRIKKETTVNVELGDF